MRRGRPTSSALSISLIAHGALALLLSVVVVTQRAEMRAVFGAELLVAPDTTQKKRVIRRRQLPQAHRATSELAVVTSDAWRPPGDAPTTAPVATAVIGPAGQGTALVARSAALPGETMTVAIRREPTTTDVVTNMTMGEARRAELTVAAPDEALPGLSSFLLGNAPGGTAAAPTPEYWREIQKRIKNKQRYPRFAREAGVEGTTTISFVLLPDGTARDVAVAESSGRRRLDEAARRSVVEAAPFPPFPPGQTGDALRLSVSIIFELR